MLMSKNALIILIHFITNLIVQLGLFIHTAFSYDYSVKNTIAWVIIGIVLTYIDYYACIRILEDKKPLDSWVGHIADLVLAIPNVTLWGYSFILDVVNSDIIKPKHSIHEIALISGIILVDTCLVLERIRLISRNH